MNEYESYRPTSHEVFKKEWCELAVDYNPHLDEPLFDLTMGTGFIESSLPSVTVEIPNLTLEDLEAIHNKFGEIINEYKKNR